MLVDVRDIDFYTGYIPGSLHCPWTDFDTNVSCLCEKYACQEKKIVFSCINSQNRAFFCARQFFLYVHEHVSKPKCEISILEGGFQSWKVPYGNDHTKSYYASTSYDLSKLATEGSLPKCETLPKVPQAVSPQKLRAQHQSLPPGEKWRLELKVGDMVEVYSKSEQRHYRGVIASADENKLHVSFFREKKCGNIVLSRTSEDLGVVAESEHCDSNMTPPSITKCYSDELATSTSTDAEAIDDDTRVQRRTRRAKSLPDAISLSKALVGEDGADNYCANNPEWHGQLQVGDHIDMYSHSDNSWHKAVVVAANKANVNLRFFRNGKCCAKVLPRSSQDLQSLLSNKLQPPEVPKPLLTKQSGFTMFLSPGGQLSDAIPTMFAEDLAKFLGDDMLQIIDVRGLDYFRGHIPGARHIPRQFFEQKLPSLAHEFAQSGKTLVFHCTESFYRGPQCARRFLDYINVECIAHTCQVFVLRGGFERWERFARGAAGTVTASKKLIEDSSSTTLAWPSIYD